MCCLGIAAALSFASSIGATFLTRDSSLRPIQMVTLAVTAAGIALTFWPYRQTVVPLAVTPLNGHGEGVRVVVRGVINFNESVSGQNIFVAT